MMATILQHSGSQTMRRGSLGHRAFQLGAPRDFDKIPCLNLDVFVEIICISDVYDRRDLNRGPW